MPDPTPKQTIAAKWLLKQSAGYPEDYIRKRIEDLLESLGIDYEIGYPTEFGPTDLYLPRRRTIIETKALGLAGDPNKPQSRRNKESPKEQLERYLRAEITRELKSSWPEDAEGRPWTGILTDGRVWHVWRYAHEKNAVGGHGRSCVFSLHPIRTSQSTGAHSHRKARREAMDSFRSTPNL